MRKIPECDWKVLRSLKDQLLQENCDRILAKLKPIVENQENDSHKSYLKLWDTLRKEDEDLGLMFDDLKRSTALFKLSSWRKHKLLSDNDFEKFSKETQDIVDKILSVL